MINCVYCPPSIKGGIPDEAIKAWHDKGHPNLRELRHTPRPLPDFEAALIPPKKDSK